MPNTTNRESKLKQRKTKQRYKRNKIKSLENAKKKTLETLHKEGKLPKVLYHRIGL